jgi:hypothetical protein
MSLTPTGNAPASSSARSRFALGSPMHAFSEELEGRVLFAIPKKG